jgi:ATP phosphoribosyltransferase
MVKFKITVSSLVTETYEIEADNADHAEEVMWDGAQPTNTEWNDAQVLEVQLMSNDPEIGKTWADIGL